MGTRRAFPRAHHWRQESVASTCPIKPCLAHSSALRTEFSDLLTASQGIKGGAAEQDARTTTPPFLTVTADMHLQATAAQCYSPSTPLLSLIDLCSNFPSASPTTCAPTLSPPWAALSSPSRRTSLLSVSDQFPALGRSPPPAPRPPLLPLPEDGDGHWSTYASPQAHQLHNASATPDAAPSIDPLLVASHPSSSSKPPLSWDVSQSPAQARVNIGDAPLSPDTLQRCAVRAAGHNSARPLRSLVLTSPHLLAPIEIAIATPPRAPPHPQRPQHPEDAPPPPPPSSHITVADVLGGLHDALRAPIEAHELKRLGAPERAALLRSAAARRRRQQLSGPADAQSSGVPRKVDYLGRRRRFLGIRPATGGEVPLGKRWGEVFVVEWGLEDE